jgi:hypothetical protein
MAIAISPATSVAPSSSIHFGVPPIDLERAAIQLIQSNSSFERTIKEYTENSIDSGANRIEVEIKGDQDGSDITVKEIIVRDNGCGMSHSMLMKNFRGMCWFNQANHSDSHKHGKNGLGAKTGLSEFQAMDVYTSTDGTIEQFVDEDANGDPQIKRLNEEVKNTFLANSKLKPGDKDTELRKYRLEIVKGGVLTPWDVCDHAFSGTTVRLFDPRPNRVVKLNADKLIKLLQTHFQWLSECRKFNEDYSEEGKKTKRGMFLKLPKSTKYEEVHSFDNGWTSDAYTRTSAKGAYLLATGSLAKGVNFVYTNAEGKIETLPGKEKLEPIKIIDPQVIRKFGLDREDMHIWLQLTYGVDSKNKDLLISISGSIVELPKKLMYSVSFGAGLDSSLRGKIYTNNPALKEALRGNRTQTDMGDPCVVAMWKYLYEVFSRMSDYYAKFMGDAVDTDDDDIVKDALSSLKSLFDKPSDGAGRTPTPPKTHTRWVCMSCNHIFDYPNGRKPVECPAGCGGTDFILYTPEASDAPGAARKGNPSDAGRSSGPFGYDRIQSIGDYVPMRYNRVSNRFEIVANHPEYTQECPKNKWAHIYRERVVQHALVALAASNMAEAGGDEKELLVAFARGLKNAFQANKKRKDAVRKRWEEMAQNGSPLVRIEMF